MEPGTHLRWSFLPQIGFPPGGFWLLRRVATLGEKLIEAPAGTHQPAWPAPGPNSQPGGLSAVMAGVQGGIGGFAGPAWTTSGPHWGQVGANGWELWGQPFTLPVTVANWPARYHGAQNPVTATGAVVAQADVDECFARLVPFVLVPGMTSATTHQNFSELRSECSRLVEGWPNQSNYAVGLQSSPDGANAPQLSFGLVEQLQLTALNPYMARVLGLYFVDRWAAPTADYDYCIAGVWPQYDRLVTLSPGDAPRGGLSTGSAKFDGMGITADNSALTASTTRSWVNRTTPPPRAMAR